MFNPLTVHHTKDQNLMELIIFTLFFLPLALSFWVGTLVGRILELKKKL
jgi:hypothetical protein